MTSTKGKTTTKASRCCAIAGGLLCMLVSCRSAPSTVDVSADEPTESSISSIEEEASSPVESTPPPPPTNSYLAQLPPEVTNQLVDLGINIAIPTYLPQNTTLANYGAGKKEAGVGGGPYYWLVYRDDQNRCFAIEYTSGGVGGISLENQEPLANALFDDDYSLYHGKFPNGEEGELPESDLFTDWLKGEDGFYRLVGAGLVNAQDYGQGDCSNISVKEALAVAESLSYLPTDIRTLDLSPTQSDLPK
ncbi:MAG: hypothetical protein AAF572_24785 [Cyanobacteria bacterium P01_B01_bin.77]